MAGKKRMLKVVLLGQSQRERRTADEWRASRVDTGEIELTAGHAGRFESHSSSSAALNLLAPIAPGQSGAGKTSLLNRFIDDSFHPQYKATLGADMRDKEVEVFGESVILQIWDTAGQERFNSLTSSYLRGADMAMLVFDITRSDSFEALALWRDQFMASTGSGKDFPFACVGNKIDVASQRAVSQRRANTWCVANGDIPYSEVSAKDATNVRQAFMDLARIAVRKLQANRAKEMATLATPPPSIVLPPSNGKVVSGSGQSNKQSSCCA